jgi:non-specific serine/threonine protein kinase
MPLPAIASSLHAQFALLVDGPQDVAPRHQTLWATITWSYDQLPPLAQQVFDRLGAFQAVWTAPAVAALCRDWPAAEVAAALALLREHHLIQATDQQDLGPAMTMLVTIRAFAQERLQASGAAALTRTRHLDYYAALVEPTERLLLGPEQIAWANMLDRIYPDLEAALAWSLASGHAATGVAMAGALWRYWYRRLRWREGGQWLERVVQATAVVADHRQYARALYAFGLMGGDRRSGPILQTGILDRAIEHARIAGDAWREASVLNLIGLIHQDAGQDDQAEAALKESLRIRRMLGDQGEVAGSLINLGGLAYAQAEFDQAQAYYREALPIFETVGDIEGIATTRYNLGVIAQYQDRAAEAVASFAAALTLREQVNMAGWVLTTLDKLALCAVRSERWDEAQAFLTRWLKIYESLEDSEMIVETTLTCAEWLARLGQPRQAMELCGGFLTLHAAYQPRMLTPEVMRMARVQALAHEHLDAATCDQRIEAGKALTKPEVEAQIRALAYGVVGGCDDARRTDG